MGNRKAGWAFRLRLLRQRGKAYWIWIFLIVGTLGYFSYVQQDDAVLTSQSIAKINQLLWPTDKNDKWACPPDTNAYKGQEKIPHLMKTLCKMTGKSFTTRKQLVSAIEGDAAEADGNYKLTPHGRQAIVDNVESINKLNLGWVNIPGWVGQSLAALFALFSLFSGSKVFGTTPLAIFETLLGFMGIKRFREQVGFRQQFASEFNIVTKAVPKNATLTLIFDDLDRCSPENVVLTLETINFLATAGPCYIFMGMDRRWAQACVSLKYQDVAEELALQKNSDNQDPNKQKSSRESLAFANNYLEKLINIEVSIPRPESEQTEALLRRKPIPRQASTVTIATRWERIKRMRKLGKPLRYRAAWMGLFRALRNKPISRLLFNKWSFRLSATVLLAAIAWQGQLLMPDTDIRSSSTATDNPSETIIPEVPKPRIQIDPEGNQPKPTDSPGGVF